jgi:hypothetical protein
MRGDAEDRDHSFTFGLRRVTGRVRIYKIAGETKMRVGQIAQQENERCIAEVLSTEKNPMIWLVILFIADYCFKTGSGFFVKG